MKLRNGRIIKEPRNDDDDLANREYSRHIGRAIEKTHGMRYSAEDDAVEQCLPVLDSASHRTFAIPELLRETLLYLPTRDQLLAQRVAPRWQETVKEHLQKQLFFQPAESVPAQP